jgi:RHS repeat-associated protein
MMMAGHNYKFVYDQVGSVREIVAPDGSVSERLDYDEFGNVLADSAPGLQPFAFAGGLRDLDTGLTRFGARDYDPTTGRWTTKDPLLIQTPRSRLAGRPNRNPLSAAGRGSGIVDLVRAAYIYANNDPISHSDPAGLDPNDWDPECSSNEGECLLHAQHAKEAYCRCLAQGGTPRLTTDNSNQNTLITGVECDFTSETCDPGNKSFNTEPTSFGWWDRVGGGDCE